MRGGRAPLRGLRLSPQEGPPRGGAAGLCPFLVVPTPVPMLNSRGVLLKAVVSQQGPAGAADLLSGRGPGAAGGPRVSVPAGVCWSAPTLPRVGSRRGRFSAGLPAWPQPLPLRSPEPLTCRPFLFPIHLYGRGIDVFSFCWKEEYLGAISTQ